SVSKTSRLETNKSDSDWIYLSPLPNLTASFCQKESLTFDSHFTSVDNSPIEVKFILLSWVIVPKLVFISASNSKVLYGMFFVKVASPFSYSLLLLAHTKLFP